MKLRKFIVLLLAVIMSVSVTSARKPKDPCEEVDTEKTAFGVTKGGMVGKYYMVTNSFYQGVGLYDNNGSLRMKTNFFLFGQNIQSIAKGSIVSIALSDGTIKQFTTVEDAAPVPQASPQGIWTEWRFEFPITKEDIGIFALNPIKAAQVKLGIKDINFELSSGDVEDLGNVAKCLSGVGMPAPEEGKKKKRK